MQQGENSLPLAWSAYADLFKFVENQRNWSRAQLVDQFNEHARKNNLPRCTYHRRSTEYWTTQPKIGKRSSKPTFYRVEHLYRFFSEQIRDLGETKAYAARLAAIAPSQFGAQSSVNIKWDAIKATAQNGEFGSEQKIQDVVSPPVQQWLKTGSNITPEKSETQENRYKKLVHDGHFDEARALAQHTLEASNDVRLMAHWADRVADAYRSSGMLLKSSEYYSIAWGHISRVLQANPDDFEIRYQRGLTRFGQIMVDIYLIRGAFGEAYKCHDQLQIEADSLLENVKDELLKSEILSRRVHIKRQQAEMLRYMGRYKEGLSLIRHAFAEYRESSYKERFYSRMSEADFLRLQGKAEDALAIYKELETFAGPESHDLPSLLGGVLWRKFGALQCLNNESERTKCLGDLEELAKKYAKNHYYVAIYSLLVKASGATANTENALNALCELETTYKLLPDNLALEYAHLCLCRGEISRSQRKTDALDWFKKAYRCYLQMECRWGIVRAWVGICISDGNEAFPKKIKRSLEGLDAALFRKFETEGRIAPGELSINMP